MSSKSNLLVCILSLFVLAANLLILSWPIDAKASYNQLLKQGDTKAQVCNAVGCGGGTQKCADATVTVEVDVGGVGGSAEVTYYCYQEPRTE